jgi:large subunit ribosomal protein L4
MASVEVYNLKGEVVGSADLLEEIFSIEPSKGALYYTVKAYLANRREGNASTKTRAEVTLSKRKVYRQKGTGRARVGTAGSPIRVGGGVAHGPKPRNFRERVPKKVKRLALKSALTLKVAEGGLKVLEDFLLEAPKTKRMADMLRAIQADGRKALLLTEAGVPVVVKSCRNLPGLSVLPVLQVSTYDVVRADTVIFTQAALDRLQALWRVS